MPPPDPLIGPETELLIFDLDGTLANLRVDWGQVKDQIRSMLGVNLTLTPLLPAIERGIPDRAARKAVYELIDHEEVKAASSLARDGRLDDMLAGLKKTGLTIALVTLQGRAAAIEAIRRLGIDDRFDIVVSRDEVNDREAQIRSVLAATGVSAARAVVIGDRREDMEAAGRVGCVSVAVGNRPDVQGDLHAASVEELVNMMVAT